MQIILTHIAESLRRHPRRVTGALGALLLGTGVTAFGIAPLAPDAADLPVRQLTEALAPVNGTWGYAHSLDATALQLHRTDTTRRDDTAQALLQRLGLDDSAALDLLRSHPQAKALFSGRAGKLVTVEMQGTQRLLKLTARWPQNDSPLFNRLVIERDGAGWRVNTDQSAASASVRLASGTIQSSLFAATDEARIPDAIASQLAEVFSGDIDFRRDLRVGDRFSVVYETLEADGEPLRSGRLLGAEFVNGGKTHQVVWFQEPGQKGGYYTLDGQSLRRAFLASPLEFSRVSSGYGMRFHPISGDRKPHLGVDFAAPTGTPVRVVADGVVQFAGWQRGYGNIVIVEHRNKQATAYAHLSKIMVRKGEKVEQGLHIGLVGSTGASTGPHLHFEFRDNGAHRDPLTLARQSEGTPLSASARAQFQPIVTAMRLKLSSAATVVRASAD